MNFIFMLTRDDQTITDCLEVLDLIRPVGLTHLGFKDVGVDPTTLQKLCTKIHAMGATSYMEVVSTSKEASLHSAKVAREIGVQKLLGGTAVDEILGIVKGSKTAYFPFPGIPVGHPTKLGGTAELVAKQCREFEAKGCAGVDLLAYRATEADPIELVKAARSAMKGELIAAGSVTSPEKIQALRSAGADAFTIGSAIFDGSYSRRKGSILSMLSDVLDACRK